VRIEATNSLAQKPPDSRNLRSPQNLWSNESSTTVVQITSHEQDETSTGSQLWSFKLADSSLFQSPEAQFQGCFFVGFENHNIMEI